MADRVPVFRPSAEEFRDFLGYIAQIEPEAAAIGLARVIPPDSWKPRSSPYDDAIASFTIKSSIRQEIQGSGGIYSVMNVERKPCTGAAYRARAEASSTQASSLDFAHQRSGAYDEDAAAACERLYWRSVTLSPPVYGADQEGTLTDPDQTVWNIAQLPGILKQTNNSISGVTTPYLYFGEWKASFAWHTEDADLYSINYIHMGAPKMWYGIPPSATERARRVFELFFPDEFKVCPEFLRHKSSIVSPQVLLRHSIPVAKTMHFAGEFMITFPSCLHSGFNVGFNVAESTNFATERWIPFGLKAKHCECSRDAVRLDMKDFLPESEWHLLADAEDHQYKWVFECSCGLSTTSDAPLADWPRGLQFECDGCGKWSHAKCSPMSASISVKKKRSEPLFCGLCAKERGIAAPPRKAASRRRPAKRKAATALRSEPAAPLPPSQRTHVSAQPCDVV